MAGHGVDVIVKNPGKLRRGVVAVYDPGGKLIVPNECVAPYRHVVPAREGNQRVRRAEIIGRRPGMDRTELHGILGLELAELAG